MESVIFLLVILAVMYYSTTIGLFILGCVFIFVSFPIAFIIFFLAFLSARE